MPSSAPRGRQFALGFVFLWFLIGGIAHFVATEVEMRIVPPFIPWPHAVVLVSGAFELLGRPCGCACRCKCCCSPSSPGAASPVRNRMGG